MNTLSLIVTLTIFLANGSMSKNLNRKPTISAPQHPAPGFNGTGINPNAKPFLKIERIDAPRILQPTIHAMPGANGSGINPNSKISTDIKPMAPLPKIESTFATPSYAPEEVNAPLAPETVTRIKVDGDHADLPPIDEEVVHSFAEKKVKAEECQCFSSTREEDEAVCQGHGFDVNQCLQHEACHWGPEENEQCQNEAAAVEMAPVKPMAPSRSAMKLP